MGEPIRVLLVDDEPSVGALAAEFLEKTADELAVTTVTSTEGGLEIIEADAVDCVVSDYDMPGENGIEFLETVRAEHGDLPFILFTAKGSEEVASDAISAGATDYLQKETGIDQYEILANRVTNVVEQRRAEARARETRRQLQSLAENSNDVLWMFNADWSELRFINQAYEAIWGRSTAELRERPESFLEGVHPDDRGRVRDAMETLSAGEPVDLEYRVNAAEDFGRWVWIQGVPVSDSEGAVEGVAGFARDVTRHKTHEVELRRERDRFERVVSAVEEYAIFMLDTDGRVTTWNAGAERIKGYTEAEILGEHFSAFYPDAAVEVGEPDRLLARATDDGSVQTEGWRVRRDGSQFWANVTITALFDDAGELQGFSKVTRDMTDRQGQERRVERERDRLSTLFENFPEPAIEYEFDDGEPVVREVNEAFVGTFGYDPETARGATINDLVVPPERYDQARSLDEQVREGERLDVEVRRQTATDERDFRIRNIATPDISGADGFAIYSDVTERRDRERRVERLRERVQDLLYARTRSEAATVASEAARDVIGAPLSGFHLLNEVGDALEPAGMIDAVDETWGEAPTYERGAAPGTRSAVVWEAFESGEPLYIPDSTAFERLAEEPLARSVLIYPVGDHGVFILAATDPGAFNETERSLTEILVTFVRTAFDRLEHETAIRDRERQLEHQNARLEEFASVISHDLRNPLNVLMGSLELAEETGDPEAFERSGRAVARMGQLIDDMLELARAGQTVADVEPVALGELVDACWSTVETADADLDNRATLTLAADASRLQQLLENLVRNAVEHGGKDVRITIGDLDDGFYVEDDGPGIPADVRDEVFDSGFSTVDGGTGFGLAIVEQIAAAHGWEVDVAIGMSGGARFEVTGVDRLD